MPLPATAAPRPVLGSLRELEAPLAGPRLPPVLPHHATGTPAPPPRGRRGKTVRIRRGAAAVIGQTPDTRPLRATAGRRPGVETSREPEDLPVESRSPPRHRA